MSVSTSFRCLEPKPSSLWLGVTVSDTSASFHACENSLEWETHLSLFCAMLFGCLLLECEDSIFTNTPTALPATSSPSTNEPPNLAPATKSPNKLPTRQSPSAMTPVKLPTRRMRVCVSGKGKSGRMMNGMNCRGGKGMKGKKA